MHRVELPARVILAILGFFTVTTIYSHRVVLNVAIVAMVNNSAVKSINENKTTSQECVDATVKNSTQEEKEGEFAWSQTIQGIVLGSFYYGYTFAQFFGGWISVLVGAKRILISTLLVTSILILLTPSAARLSFVMVICVRFINGLCQGLTYPAVYTLLGRWAPMQERSTLITICTSGNQFGTILAMSLTGFLCQYGFAGGWPSAFYVFGIMGCVLTSFLIYFIYESPSVHPRISTKELKYLKKNICSSSNVTDSSKIPWKSILTSGPVWAIAIAKFCWSWGFYTLLSKLPSYLATVLHFPIQQNSLINALVYIANSASLIISGYISDVIIKKGILQVTTVRKICETIGLLGPGICMAIIPLIGCDTLKVIILLTISMGLFGCIGGGDMVAVVDLAPDYAGTIFGLTNGLSCIPGFLAPHLAGILLDKDPGSMTQWSYIFYISTGFYVVGFLSFLILSSAKIQPWAKREEKNDKNIYTLDDQYDKFCILSANLSEEQCSKYFPYHRLEYLREEEEEAEALALAEVEVEEEEEEEEEEKSGDRIASKKKEKSMKLLNRIPARYVVTSLGFLTFCIFYSQRVVINVAIVAMVNNTAYMKVKSNLSNELNEMCPDTKGTNVTFNYKSGEYLWSPSIQGIVLGSYFYGFICTQVAGGMITEKLGPKNVFTGTLLISSLATMLIPFLSEHGAALVIVLRSLTGLAQGVAYPAMYTLLSRWSPVVERGTLAAFCWTGNNMGTILSMTVTGYLCEYGFSGGWPSAFYVFGALGCLMFLILLLFLYESPESHPRISNKELFYIQQDQTNITAKQNIPWKGILTSGAVWSLAIARFFSAWTFFTLLTKLPAYFESVLHSPIDENGWMNSVFHFLLALSTLFCGYFSDFLRKKHICGLTTLRKFFVSGGRLLVSICLMIVTQIGCDKTLAISLLAISLTAFGMNAGGDVPIIMDMANNYAGILFGLTNGFACLAGVFSPLIAGVILDKNEGSLTQWNIVFYLSSGLCTFGSLIFIIKGSAEIQPWANQQSERQKSVQKVNAGECISTLYVFPARYILTLLAFLTMCFQYAQRVILSITMVTMVNITDTNGQNLTERLVKDDNVEITQIYKESKQYDWSPTTQGIMLAGFFYGFLFGQLNAGWVISRIGAKLIFVGGTAVCSLSVFIIPLITDFGYEVVVIARIFTGLSQGLSFPAMYNLIAKWAPIRERSALLSISVSGNSIGTVLSMILGGYLCKYGFFGGWPSAFYIFGLLGFVLTILLAVLIYESPEVHPRISKQELIYIIENTPNVTDKKQPIPWKSILTSKPVWTVAVTKFCWGWGYYTILTKLPVYMESILHYSVDKNGFLNALFHTAEGLSSVSSGFLSDYLRNRQCLKITVIRKIFEAGGMLGPAICLISIPLIGYNPLMVIIMLTLSLGLFGMTGGGDFPTVVDMAPSFAGVIYSLVNSVGCSSAVFCPYIAGILLEESHGSIEKWSLVFYISAGFFVFGGILFLLTASSEVQPWATITKDDKPLFREKTDNFVDNSKESDVNVKV
ncbi:uncharacterized protein LOC111619972 [Centruroides sculpturatus]|uniref:uncharacterized protein LOC111619972 n=1 Tax=Centruroides sculpturatus TaxID=218467 RepID=UPI000C6CC294|nr:uncharacterized protein LOC111619972 [Centruroides sculpturatus]